MPLTLAAMAVLALMVATVALATVPVLARARVPGFGTKGQQAGGAIAPGHKPTTKTTVSTKTETKDNKSDKKDTDKSDKKDEKKSDKKDSKSDKKSDSKSDTGAASTTTAKKSSSASEQETGTNPLAIVGVAAGVIGLAIVGVFVFTKRR